MLAIKPSVAPSLNEPRPGKASRRTMRQGEVARLHARLGGFRWEGEVEGVKMVREGEILDVKRAEVDGPTFVFASDLEEADVPAAGWLCDRLGNPGVQQTPCVQTLRRTLLPEARLLAFVPGVQAVCPVGLVRGTELTVVDVAGLHDVRVMTMNGQEVALAWSRWVRGEEWTGAEVVVLLTRPTLHKIGQVLTEEADGRTAGEVTNRMGQLQIESDGLRFAGKRRVFDRATGKEKGSQDISETWRVTQDGQLEPGTRN